MKAQLRIEYYVDRFSKWIAYNIHPLTYPIECNPSSIYVSIAKYAMQFNTTLNKKKVIKYLAKYFKRYNIELGEVVFEKVPYCEASEYALKKALKEKVTWTKNHLHYKDEFTRAHEDEK